MDTTLNYATGLFLSQLLMNADQNNVNILQQEKALVNAGYDVGSTRANAIPKVILNGNYGWTENNLGAASFIRQQRGFGPSVTATLSWNIFDGGATRTRTQVSKIVQENQAISLEQQRLNTERDLSNAWTAYQTALFVKNAETKNLETAQTNFDRSVDQYKLGTDFEY